MATIKELETQLESVNTRLARVQVSNSELRDEIVVLKNNYGVLVEQVSERLEAIHTRFQGSK
jgi:septation ring formation regulator EzrA|tara:strand:- start:122 stop:307 length:186 start_codon:yes stop_codon:yes gene_type:complete